MPASRKKAKGKARKAAKAQQQEQAQAAAANQAGSLHSQLSPRSASARHHQGGGGHINSTSTDTSPAKRKCQHGFGTHSFADWRICKAFMGPFMDAFNSSNRHDDQDLRAAMDATFEPYREVWNDPAKLKWVISCFVANGTRYLLDGTGGGKGQDEFAIQDYAIIAYFLEEYVRVMTSTSTLSLGKKSMEKDGIDWAKIRALQMRSKPTEHDLVKFYHERNPCKCLEKRYKEGEAVRKEMMALEEKNRKDTPNEGGGSKVKVAPCNQKGRVLTMEEYHRLNAARADFAWRNSSLLR